MTYTAFAIKHCSNNLRDKTTTLTTKVNLSSMIYKERKAELLDGKCNFCIVGERKKIFKPPEKTSTYIPLFWKTKERFSYNYMRLREMLNFQLTGEKYCRMHN